MAADRTSQAETSCRVLHVMTVPESLMLLRGQAAYLRERGVVMCVVAAPGPSLDAFAESEGVQAFAVPMYRRITPLRDIAAVLALRRLMRHWQPDIVHAHTPKAGVLGMLAAKLAGVQRRIYHLRGLPSETASGLRRWVLRFSERTACLLASRVISVSVSLRAVVIRDNVVPSRKIRVLANGSGNGVDVDGRFNPARTQDARDAMREQLTIPQNAVVILYVGRLAADKGIIELSRAWHELRQESEAIYLAVVGPIDARDPIGSKLLLSLAKDSRVRLTGAISDMPRMYAASDLVVLPSHREGFPNVALEASAMALPVILSNATGCVDAVVPGVTGTLSKIGDEHDLAAAIRTYLNDPGKRAQHGMAGRQWVSEAFRSDLIWSELSELYRLLMRWRRR